MQVRHARCDADDDVSGLLVCMQTQAATSTQADIPPGAKVCQVANDLVDSIVFAYTVVRPVAKGQEVLLVLYVFFALRAETVRVKHRWVAEALQGFAHTKHKWHVP